jgi:glycosyltransferase involved in cell wall biosynthesis
MYGGAEVVAVATVNALVQNGYEIVLFVNKTVDQKRITEMIGERLSSCKVIVKPIFLEPRATFHVYESAARSLIFKSYCDLLVDTYSCNIFPWIDVSYIHFPYLNNYDFRRKFPYLKTPHIRSVLTTPYAIFEKNLEKYDGKLLLANSFFTAKAIKESLGAEARVLYPPIPNALFTKESPKYELPRENIVVSVARFGYGKGVELVPEIANLVDKKTKFVMIGLAHDLVVVETVKKRIRDLKLEDRVSIITNASRETIISYLRSAKVYLHTMKMEHFGISIAEAMAMGCIPVVHNSGGAPEFVPDEYRYNDLNQASDIVKKAILKWDSKTSRELTARAEQFSEANYSKKFIKLFMKYSDSRNNANKSK